MDRGLVLAAAKGMRNASSADEPRSAMNRYLGSIGSLPLLDRDTELQMARDFVRTRDPRLRERLARANLRLVVSLARDYHAGGDLADLIQEGNIGLLRAIDRFDPDRGVRLGSYAGWWIRAFIVKHLIDTARLVPSARTREGRRQFFKGALPPAELSLDTTDYEGGDPLGSRLPGPADGRPDVAAEAAEEHRLAHALVNQVLTNNHDERKTAIVRERWLHDEPIALGDLGRRFALTKERMRQLERELFVELRGAFGHTGRALSGAAC